MMFNYTFVMLGKSILLLISSIGLCIVCQSKNETFKKKKKKSFFLSVAVLKKCIIVDGLLNLLLRK